MLKYLGTITQLSRETGILEVVECSLVKRLHCLRGTMGEREF
jgi:hypothetical protein